MALSCYTVPVRTLTSTGVQIQPRYNWRLRTERRPQKPKDILSLLLELRGIGSEKVSDFLSPAYERSLHDPSLLPQSGSAVTRLQRALHAREPIAVFGDYDVDGVTGAALTSEVLRTLGGVVKVELPHREDGYGLSVASVRRLVPPAKLLITVDNGTSAASAVAEAIARGADVMILDHHAVTGALPAGALVVNPALPSSRYPTPWPAAVGVAWKIAAMLLKAEGRSGEETLLLDLVVLGTLADGVALLEENRTLVRWGMDVLRHSRRPGLRALAERVGMNLRDVTTDALTFRFIPRLNAAGRLRHASMALELLETADSVTALRLASELDAVNGERRLLTDDLFASITGSLPSPVPSIIFVAGPWPIGIVGLLANRLAEQYQRTAIAAAVRDGECVASARGAPGGPKADGAQSMVSLLQEAGSLLTKYGGHAGAAGFSFPRSALETVAAFFSAHAPLTARDGSTMPELAIDCLLPFSLVTPEVTRELEVLEPFGHGNDRPLFQCDGLSVIESRRVGSPADHLRLILQDRVSGARNSAIAFRRGRQVDPVAGDTIDLVGEVRQDSFRGVPRAGYPLGFATLHVQDLRRSTHSS